MRVSDKNLLENANAYVKDGVLVKWRPYGMSIEKAYEYQEIKEKGIQLNDKQIKELKQLDQVVIEQSNYVLLVNYSGLVLKY